MPLIKSKTDSAFKTNVAEMIRAGHPRDQSLAAAYRVKRGKANGGLVAGFAQGGPPKMSINPPYYARAEARGLGHTGPILSAVGGRTDHHAMSVPAKSYVLPADHVSSLGQGNSLNGLAVLNKMFPIKHGAGPPRPPQMGRIRAAGGATGGEGPVPIYAAGGEFVISPEHVAELGGGDHAHGHKILDHWVKSNRKKLIKTLSNLPGPAKD